MCYCVQLNQFYNVYVFHLYLFTDNPI